MGKQSYFILIGILASGIALLAMMSYIKDSKGAAYSQPEYVTRLFDTTKVHTIDLQVDDWKAFIENAPKEEYQECSIVINGETFHTVGLRAKGNNSRRQTEKYELSRYSLKLEFDYYIKGGNYYGLDKFSLDSSFQDNSYLKTFLVYDMMKYMEVPSPLCSYAWVTVNGTPWGLFLAIEEPEEAFAKRCFGNEHGQLYKPDYRYLKDENADVDLRYVDDDPNSYDNIFRKAKFVITEEDKKRLIQSLKILSSGENLSSAVNVDEVLRYFATQIFVLNMDSYLGSTGHNYFLYEEDGILSMLPWDYNLAFGTYCFGMREPIKDNNVIINYPINTPWKGSVMKERPLFHNIMSNEQYFRQYHAYLDQLLTGYFENGHYEQVIAKTTALIEPYVKQDPTAYCNYEDHLLAVETLRAICNYRAKSIRGQLAGRYPSTFREQSEKAHSGVDVGDLDIRNLGDFKDLENAKERQDAASCKFNSR